MRELDEVVEETDRAAGDGDEEHGQTGHLVPGEHEERQRGRDDDQNPAGSRRALFFDVPLGSFLADLLAELLAPEEIDEARTDDDRDDAGDDSRDQDSRHAFTPAKDSATRSSPRTRAPLTSTQSPGPSSARRSAIAASASATWRPP